MQRRVENGRDEKKTFGSGLHLKFRTAETAFLRYWSGGCVPLINVVNIFEERVQDGKGIYQYLSLPLGSVAHTLSYFKECNSAILILRTQTKCYVVLSTTVARRPSWKVTFSL